MGLSLGGRVSVFVSDNTPGNSVNCCTSTQWLTMSVFEWKHSLCVNIAYVNLVKISCMWLQRGTFNCDSIINLNIMHLRLDWEWMLGVKYKKSKTRTACHERVKHKVQTLLEWGSIEKVTREANLMIVMFHLLKERKSTSICQSITSLLNTCQVKLSWISSRSTPPLQPHSHKHTRSFTLPYDAFPSCFY